MLRFFKKNIPLEKLEQLLQAGAGVDTPAVLYALRKQFNLTEKHGALFYTKLKQKNTSDLAFDFALKQLPEVLKNSSRSALQSFEYIWDKEIINLLQSGDEILMRRTINYLVSRFTKIKFENRYKKFSFEASEKDSVFNDTFDKFIRYLQSGTFEQKSTLRTFFSKILYGKFVDKTRELDANKRVGDRNSFWDDDDHYLDNLILSKGKIQDGLSKIDYDFLMKVLDEFKQLNKSCYDLIITSILKEVSLPVIAEQQGKTANNLGVKRFNCVKALRLFWKNNQNI